MQNGIPDMSSAFNIPTPQVHEDYLTEEKKVARFTKTEEFKRLKTYIEGRIAFMQTNLPDGRALSSVVGVDLTVEWKVANAVIGELKSILDQYERVKEAVKNARTS